MPPEPPEPDQLDPSIIAEDRASARAIEQLAEHQPTESALSVAALQRLEAAMLAAEEAEERARQAYEQSRATQLVAMRSLVGAMRRLGTNVVVQYGDGGYAVQAIEWMRPSELWPPAQRALAA